MVLSKQWEFGFFVMIEQDVFPIPLGMAALTLGAKTSFVLVILPMARDAIGLQLVLVQVSLVTTDAFHFMVFAEQRVFGFLVVIEQDLFPFPICVAGFALGTKGTFVLVVLFMALVTLLRSVLIFFIGVATLALYVCMLAK